MSNQETLPESFIEHVKEALEKLYDFQALQENTLTRRFDSRKSDSPATGAYQFRILLIDAIESLNPGQNVAMHSGMMRVYNLIYMHYIGKLTIQQAAYEVGVSLRQAYRDLRRGQELVSAVLWHKFQSERSDAHQTQQEVSVNAELTRLEDNTTIMALQKLLGMVMRPIQILANKYNIAIVMEEPVKPIMMTTNHTIGRQILTHILSQLIQQIRPIRLKIQLLEDRHFVCIQYEVETATPSSLYIEPVILQLMAQIHWELQMETHENIQEIRLKSSRHRLVIVIDDNEGLVHLLQRYLTEEPYTVMAVSNTEQGLHIISELQPDVIILDVMMPGMDGWELLQRLRIRSETRLIPVVICSVIYDPELAYSLGASQYISKPVTRESLLQALQI